MKLAVLGSTKGNTLQFIIDAIEEKRLDATISLVISNKEQAYILERAQKHHLKTVYISQKDKSREEFDQEVMKLLEEHDIDLVLLIGYMRYISKEFVDKWRYKILNVHPSLLPKFGGGMDMNVHQAVLDANETETGMSIHFVDEKLDAGPIILQKKCSIDPEETVDTLKKKVQLLEGEGFIEIIQKFSQGKIRIENEEVIIE